MKQFTVTINVINCRVCPYNTQETWCTESDFETPEEYEKQYFENKNRLTTCPKIKNDQISN